jgi:hypothetical protein
MAHDTEQVVYRDWNLVAGTWVAQEFAFFLKRSIDSYLMIAMLLLLSAAGKTIKSIQEFFK